MNFHIVSLQPNNKQMVDKNLIKHYKTIQEQELYNWKGINTKFTSRPGLGDCQNQVSGVGGVSGSNHSNLVSAQQTVNYGGSSQI